MHVREWGASDALEELIEDARAPERTIRTTEANFERDAQAEVRRPVTPELLAAFRAGLREDNGQLVSIVTPEVRGAAMAGLTETRVTASWGAIAATGIPILLMVATEPQELRERSQAALPDLRRALSGRGDSLDRERRPRPVRRRRPGSRSSRAQLGGT